MAPPRRPREWTDRGHGLPVGHPRFNPGSLLRVARPLGFACVRTCSARVIINTVGSEPGSPATAMTFGGEPHVSRESAADVRLEQSAA
jgi:hypothetical protein